MRNSISPRGAFEANGLGGGIDGDGLVEQLEDALGSGHGGLQDVEFFAEVLDGAEKARGVHREGGQYAEAQAAGEDAIAAGPVDQGDRDDAEKFDGGIEQRKGQDGVVPGLHVVAIAFGKFDARFSLAIEQLHYAHAGNVFLEERVDARDRGANAAVGVAHELAEEIGDHEDEGQHGEGIEREAMVDGKEPRGHDGEEEEIVDHGDDAGGEEIVQGVDVGGDAGDQAADGVAVEVAHGQALDVGEDLACACRTWFAGRRAA